VHKGELESAVQLIQGSHTDWEEVEGENEAVVNEECVILRQPEKPVSCEITGEIGIFFTCNCLFSALHYIALLVSSYFNFNLLQVCPQTPLFFQRASSFPLGCSVLQVLTERVLCFGAC
jgi:hypothetical protein